MTALKVYADLMSQPSRAVTLFVKVAQIPHQFVQVVIKKGEHLDPSYVENVNRFGRVPAIIHGQNNIVESVAILRYLCRTFSVPDYWYPKDSSAQAKVDEYLEWQHIGVRVPLSMYFQSKFIIPLLSGQPPNTNQVASWKSRMEQSLDDLESIWLKTNPYLAGDKISIADLVGICEVDQPRMAGFDPSLGRPRLAMWLKRVRQDTHPHYEEVTSVVNMVISKFKGDPPSALSKL